MTAPVPDTLAGVVVAWLGVLTVLLVAVARRAGCAGRRAVADVWADTQAAIQAATGRPVPPRGQSAAPADWPTLSMVRQVTWPDARRVRAVVAHGRAAGLRVEHSHAFGRHYIYATGCEPHTFGQFRAELDRIFSSDIDVVLGEPGPDVEAQRWMPPGCAATVSRGQP